MVSSSNRHDTGLRRSRKARGPSALHRALAIVVRRRVLGPLLRLTLLLLLLLAGGACSWRDDLDGQRRAPEGANEAVGSPPERPDDSQVAIDLHASRPLMDVYRRGALVMDAGSASFAKYVDGGMRRDWHRGLHLADTSGQSRSASAVRGLAAELYFPLDADEGGILRTGGKVDIRFTVLPAVDNQLVSVFLNEQKLGDLRMEKRVWKSRSMSAPAAALREGENKLRFYFRSTGELGGHKSAAAFSTFVVGSSLRDEPVFHAGPVVSGGERRNALQVHAASRLSAYLLVPASPCQLQFSVIGKGKASVRVRAQGDAGSAELWSEPSLKQEWTSAAVPLHAHRGQIVRLDFLSEDALAWASLRVTRDREQEEAGNQKKQARQWPAPDHIIVWSVASLRSDRLRSKVGRAFRRFAEQGFYIREAQASVPAAGGAHASAMTGQLRVRSSIPDSQQTLAERLQEAGYATALISGNGFVNEAAGYAQGFDHYDNPMRRQHHYGAKTLWRQARRFLDKHKGQRSFVHIVTVEPHLPYRPSEDSLQRAWPLPAPFPPAKTLSLGEQIAKGRRVMTTNEQSYVRALYDASVDDNGEAFASMLEGVEELSLQGTVAIILSGDHGEQLWERGTFGHGASLYQESLQVPLAIHAAGLQGLRPPRRGSSVDLYPTILDLAGLEPGPQAQGLSLLGNAAQLDTRPIMAGTHNGSRSVRWGRYKLIHPIGGGLELYDLEADPAEQKELSGDTAVVTRALRIVLATATAYETVWSTARWGLVSSPREAFARDLGM